MKREKVEDRQVQKKTGLRRKLKRDLRRKLKGEKGELKGEKVELKVEES